MGRFGVTQHDAANQRVVAQGYAVATPLEGPDEDHVFDRIILVDFGRYRLCRILPSAEEVKSAKLMPSDSEGIKRISRAVTMTG
jgi:hypothetical protein